MVETIIEQHISPFYIISPSSQCFVIIFANISPNITLGGGFKAVVYPDFIADSDFPKYWYLDHDYMTHFGGL